ncbi:hypothetical protein C4544_02535 [candidate division WS5 bacterium]|uniref:SGNH/GDSL hydrolase family protein n=1 Tax=candidate division WS5 bacterium TaxID=2093353 RepID=A0A419DEF4_9BACT|nr:MAG: hypothetical protein C4544_02535 [candidate division WS5 bacterium]
MLTLKEHLNLGKLAKAAIFYLVLIMLFFIVVEGLSSVTMFIIGIFTRHEAREAKHAQYDELLGWVNKPNVYIKDLYGPNVYLRTNSQGFRSNTDFTANIPQGKIRIICTGDSFTLGYGVDNDNAWCQLLSANDERLETVNMGQGGYGIDQAYLWYMRDGRKLEHDIHIFAFIDDDFRRATSSKFWNYQKPVFKLKGDTLIIDNVPVPRYQFETPVLTRIATNWRNFQMFQLLGRMRERSKVQLIPYKGFDEPIRNIALKIFEALHQAHKEKGSTLVVLYLPTDYDYSHEVPWRKFLSDEFKKRDIIFIDMTPEFVKQPMNLMFKVHYSEYGNKYLADALYKKLTAIPEIRNKLSKVR